MKRPTLPDLPRPPWLTAGTAVVLVTALMSVGDAPASAGTQAVVRRGDVTATVGAAGNVGSADTRELVFGTSGTVTELDVRPGDKVKAGQVLARLDDGPAKDQVQVAKAVLAAAQDTYDKALQGICTGGAGGGSGGGSGAGGGTGRGGPPRPVASPRPTRTGRTPAPSPTRTSPRPTPTPRPTSPRPTTSPSPTPSPTHHPRPTGTPTPTHRPKPPGGSGPAGTPAPGGGARTGGAAGGCPPGAVQQASAKVTQANVQVRQAERTLAATTLRAPMPGTVLAVGGAVGDQTGATSRTGFITLGDLDDLQVRAMFSLGDARSLRIGQRAAVAFTVSPGRTYSGTIAGIDPAATTSGSLARYGVGISLDDAPPHLLIGMSATVEVVTAQADDALYVPAAAVRARHGDTATLLVRSGGRTVDRTVTLGVRGDRYVVITRGLAAGDRVLVPSGTGPDGFPDGSFPAT